MALTSLFGGLGWRPCPLAEPAVVRHRQYVCSCGTPEVLGDAWRDGVQAPLEIAIINPFS